MTTKEKLIVEIQDAELTNAVVQLYGKRKAMKIIVEQEELLKDRVKEIILTLEEPEGTVFQIPGSLQVQLTVSSGRNTLNKDKLIDAGVLPSQIEKGYKQGEPFTKVEVGLG